MATSHSRIGFTPKRTGHGNIRVAVNGRTYKGRRVALPKAARPRPVHARANAKIPGVRKPTTAKPVIAKILVPHGIRAFRQKIRPGGGPRGNPNHGPRGRFI